MINFRRILLTILIIFLGLCRNVAFAQTAGDRLISSTFKTLAKTYIAATDLDALQKKTIARLKQLDTDSFRQNYPRALRIIHDSPVLTAKFGLRSDMTVEQAVVFIKMLNKKKVLDLIDAADDQAIARYVMESISKATHSLDSKNTSDQVNAVWHNFQDKLDRTAKISR